MTQQGTIRPQTFEDFTGQKVAREILTVAIRAALRAGRPLSHVLMAGPPGTGKTSLAAIVANQLGTRIEMINCASVEKPQDLLPTLTTMAPGEVLFLDEIHALQGTGCWDYLLTVLEDAKVTVRTGDPQAPKLMTIELPRFTIIGATTRAGKVPETIRDRFHLQAPLTLYSDPEMAQVLAWTAGRRDLVLSGEAQETLTPACHGTARWAVRLVEACRDTLEADGHTGPISGPLARQTLDRLGYRGDLTGQEYQVLEVLGESARPLGVSTLAAKLDEDLQTVEETLEPWLLQRNYIEKTPQGRVITPAGKALLV